MVDDTMTHQQDVELRGMSSQASQEPYGTSQEGQHSADARWTPLTRVLTYLRLLLTYSLVLFVPSVVGW